jgi:aryl-alcohol dehydrogenase-like predicted oxidoreductase
MRTKNLGTLGATSAIGLGLLGMSGGAYGATDRAESITTIHAAVDAGITLLDTGDFYGMGHNEMLLADALEKMDRNAVQISVKFGSQRDPDGALLGVDARPNTVKTSLAYSLQRLRTDHIDVYRPARLDPSIPIEDTVGAIKEMINAGYVRHLGLSEVSAETIRRAHAVHPVSDLQIEYSLISREPEGEILDTCRELGIGVTAYGVLSRGLLSGHWSADRTDLGDFRTRNPRFNNDNLSRNLALVNRLRDVAGGLGVSVAQAAIAWVGAQGDNIVPLIGAHTRHRLAES